MISYYNRFEQQPKGSLLHEALHVSKQLSDSGFDSWYANVNNICRKFSCLGVKDLQWKDKRTVFNLLNTFYLKHWTKSVNPNATGGKLQLYGELKHGIRQEDYLNEVKNIYHRHALTKLRISAHSLAVETGRYGKNRLPRNLRLCTLCNTGEVEDEEHFLLGCKSFDEPRIILLNLVRAECQNFDALIDHKKILYLLNAGGKIIRAVAKFCHEAQKMRTTILNS